MFVHLREVRFVQATLPHAEFNLLIMSILADGMISFTHCTFLTRHR